jgi:hypothetical protein
MMHPISVAEFIGWLRRAPAGTTLAAERVLEILEADAPAAPSPQRVDVCKLTWRERFWGVNPEMRIGVAELAESLGRPKSYIYRHTSRKSGLPLLPHRRLDGDLVFVVGEVRRWVELHEQAIVRAL